MLYGFLAVLALGILIIVHECGHYLVARFSNMRVDRFAVGFGPALLRRQRGETVFQIGAIPLGGYVQIAGLNPEDEAIEADDPRAYPNRPAWQRFLTIAAGPIVNYMFAVLLIFVLHAVIGVYGVTADKVTPDSPAAAAGVQAGDQLYRVDGYPVSDPNWEVQFVVGQSKGRPIDLEVLRNGQIQKLTVTPKLDNGTWRLGILMGTTKTRQRHSLVDSLLPSLYTPAVLSIQTLKSLGEVIRGKQRADFKSPVGITRIMKEQMERGLVSGLQFVAMISALLGLFNLLPLPALDGGRLVFLGWELVTRRKVNQRVEQIVHMVGMILLLGLLLILVVKDVREWIFGH